MTIERLRELQRIANAMLPGKRSVITYDSGLPDATFGTNYPPRADGFKWSNSHPSRADAEAFATFDRETIMELIAKAITAVEET